ncbi:hypothetical protein OH77DRAFT_1418542 [Trametes cingulata]|nr:hypothetical protein OH77DRAFT_1418542 [Trametes cingulata]
MSSYYREHVSFPNVTSGPAPPYPQPVAAANNVAHNYGHAQNAHNNNATQGAQDDPDAKRCSVKGCAVLLAPGYPHKMCEECRGRHRIYATTKRAKRKMEKALLNSAQTGQPVVWMPEDDAAQQEREMPPPPSEPVAGPSRPYEPPSQIPQINDENSQPFDFSQTWDPRALDPRLFSQASELAGALTLPHGQQHSSEHNLFSQNDQQYHQPQQQQQQHQSQPAQSHLSQHPQHTSSHYVPQHHQPPPPQHAQNAGPPPPPPAPEIHPVLAEVLKAVPNLNLSVRITSGPTVPVGAAAPPVDGGGQLPPRFCSIKGCKTLIAGNSFFKMCEPCRNRYRNYGTTKRAKWRKEKEVAVQELQKLREEEDKRRAEQGLPPLPPDDDIWHEYAASPPEGPGTPLPQVGPSSAGAAQPIADGKPAPRPPRMCTVSHCREILPGDYQFLRCERHRIQNRHHSKLKRVRDKEVKAQVYDGWAAAVGVRATSTGSGEGDQEGGSMSPEAEDADLPLELEEIERQLRDASVTPDYSGPPVVAESGVSVQQSQGGSVGRESEPLDETPLGEPIHGVPPAARGTRRTNHVCSIKSCANLLSPSNPWKMCDLCRSRDRAGRRLKALRDSGLIPPELADGHIEKVKMEVEGKTRGAGSKSGAEPGEKKSKKRKKKSEAAAVTADNSPAAGGDAAPTAGPSGSGATEATEATGTVAVEATGEGSIAPSALHQPAATSSSTSLFSGMSGSEQGGIVFMDPMSPEEAANIKTRHEKSSSFAAASTPAAADAHSSDTHSNGIDPQQTVQNPGTAAASSTPEAPPKKRAKGKGKAKAKASEQPSSEQPAPAAQQSQSQSSSQAADAGAVSQPSTTDTASSTAPAPSTDGSQLPPQPPYPLPPSGYPYYMPPPYMPPYPPPPNYGYPYSPGKGQYPPPPMYQPPYGSYPYPYPGQPYGYPGPPYPPPPGHPYPPPPPGQGYPPPPQSSAQAGQPYPPPPQPYPYAYPPPPPPPPPNYHSSPPPPQPSSTQQEGERPQDEQAQQPVSHHFYNTFSPQSSEPPDPQHEKSATSASAHAGAPSSDAAPQRFSTFIVRTEETYQNEQDSARPASGMKRKRGESEYQASGGYSEFRVDAPAMPVAGMVGPPGAWPRLPTQSIPSDQSMRPTPAPAVADKQAPCSNKHCKRLLSASSSASLCDRCKERLKKKQAKAKHRFKLEPKSLLGRSVTAQPAGSIAAHSELASVQA